MDDRSGKDSVGRRGWLWTLGKCAVLLAVCAGLGALGLWMLLHRIEPPWFVPRAVFVWLVERAGPFAAWLGAALGAFAGFLASVAVVMRDARKGRLSKLR
jgi:hypothetical protein